MCAELKSFLVFAKAAFIVAIALAGITLVFCCLAVATAGEPKCMGHEWAEGYRTRDFLVLPVVSAVIVALVGHMAWGRSERLRSLFELHNVPVFEFASKQVTFSTVVFAGTILGALGAICILMGISITHYQAIVTGCLS